MCSVLATFDQIRVAPIFASLMLVRGRLYNCRFPLIPAHLKIGYASRKLGTFRGFCHKISGFTPISWLVMILLTVNWPLWKIYSFLTFSINKYQNIVPFAIRSKRKNKNCSLYLIHPRILLPILVLKQKYRTNDNRLSYTFL